MGAAMGELVRGNVSDRPWGATLAGLWSRGVTGQLTLRAGPQVLAIALIKGAIVGARGSDLEDAVMHPRAIARCAARSFGFERGEFAVHEETSIPTAAGMAIDPRVVIYLGARSEMSRERLTAELRRYGERFRITGVIDFVRYGMHDAPGERLRAGVVIDELSVEELPMVYALACTNACIGEAAPARSAPRPTPSPTPPPMPAVSPADTRKKLLADLEERISRRVDHFALFGLPFDAPPVAVKSACAGMTRRLQPLDADSKKVITHITNASAILTDPDRRATYITSVSLARGTEREPIPALPDASLVWAKFAEAQDKLAIAEETRRLLAAASARDMLMSTYYLACVARDLDRPREALRLFQRVLHLDPSHADARREVAELARKAEKKGLLDRFRR
jgi:hypothetical protein